MTLNVASALLIIVPIDVCRVTVHKRLIKELEKNIFFEC